ncbi:hypothetical protein RRG08_027673 [Elysia crispata]|uniref:Uncharacterized protein n=1 Tax=Elysia crispata TaxID=231223 RepID=A0AAE0XM58_9GAST|nr:hypothetical protein RRG08_027673 [Elysia crispata]
MSAKVTLVAVVVKEERDRQPPTLLPQASYHLQWIEGSEPVRSNKPIWEVCQPKAATTFSKAVSITDVFGKWVDHRLPPRLPKTYPSLTYSGSVPITDIFRKWVDHRLPPRLPKAYPSPTCTKSAWTSDFEPVQLAPVWRNAYTRVPKVRAPTRGRASPSIIPRRKSWRAGVRQLPAALLAQTAGPPPVEVPPPEDLDMVVLQAGLAVDVSRETSQKATMEHVI